MYFNGSCKMLKVYRMSLYLMENSFSRKELLPHKSRFNFVNFNFKVHQIMDTTLKAKVT